MRASGFMADLIVLCVLAATIVWAPDDPRVLVLVLALGILSLLPWMHGSAGESGVRADQGLILLCLFLLAWPLTLPASRAFWFLSGVAGFACLSGLVIATVRRRAAGKWTPVRKTTFWAALVGILVTVSVAGTAHALLALRSTSPLVPGRMDFVWTMLIWAGIWFGLDAHFRDMGVSDKNAASKRFRDRRFGWGLVVTTFLLLFRVVQASLTTT